MGRAGRRRGRPTLAIVYTALAAALAASVVYIHYAAPILYADLVAEDEFGEYTTAIAFGCAGLLLIVLALRPGPRTRKISWWIIGIAAIIVAGEEISWGERFFRSVLGVTTPAVVRDLNLQNEFNLHNLKGIDIHARNYPAAAVALLGWVFLSAVMATLRPQWFEKLLDAGLPLVPPRLIGMFLLVPGFILLQPVTWWPEIAELFMGLTALTWAYDRWLHLNWLAGGSGRPIQMIGVPAASALLLALLAVGLSSFTPADTFGFHLNRLASYYAGRGLYQQAETVYQHIYANREYLRPETRLSHATMLKGIAGRDADATRLLTAEAAELEGADRLGKASSNRLRLLGAAYHSLGRDQDAQAVFARAIEVDDHQLQAASSADEKAVLLLSIAKTLASCGDPQAAVRAAQEALTQVHSAEYRRRIGEWLEENQTLDAPIPESLTENLCVNGGNVGRAVVDRQG